MFEIREKDLNEDGSESVEINSCNNGNLKNEEMPLEESNDILSEVDNDVLDESLSSEVDLGTLAKEVKNNDEGLLKKIWCGIKKHKNEIIIVAVATVTGIWLLSNQKNHYEGLRNEDNEWISTLESDLYGAKEQISQLKGEKNNLLDMLKSTFVPAVSDGLRHGSSECASAMRGMQDNDYLN